MFSRSPQGAKASAAIYTLVETAKANGLSPMKYIKYILSDMPGSAFLEYPEYLDDYLPYLFKFYVFFAVISFLLHILFWLADFLLPICCQLIVNDVNKFDNIYFENTASFLESRYTQY